MSGKEYQRQYYLANREKHNAACRAWRAANPEKVLAAKRAWRAANREKVNAESRAYRAANPEKRAATIRASKYGLTTDAFEILRAKQQNRCALCGKEFGTPFVDHDHATGKVRGLLCRNCNLGLGKLGDTVEGLWRAVRYLEGNL